MPVRSRGSLISPDGGKMEKSAAGGSLSSQGSSKYLFDLLVCPVTGQRHRCIENRYLRAVDA